MTTPQTFPAWLRANGYREATIAAAQNAGVMSLCHQCARGEADEWSTSGGLDCDPSASPLVDVTVDGEEDAIALAKAQEVWS